jgi:2-dehydro-3-deoxy-D-arabinonate dehydratase
MSAVAGLRVVRLSHPDGAVRTALVKGDNLHVLPSDDVLGILRGDTIPEPVQTLIALDPETLEPPPPWRLLAPLIPPETWAAGVTYERSRDARVSESQFKSVYDLVYDAERPELFLKDAAGRRTVGPGAIIAPRADATWTVPEPELAIVLDGDGQALAVTIGNDVSSRDIEASNPLYVPQAKVYARACALGPALLVPADWSAPFAIELRILSVSGETLFAGQTSTARMKRSFGELISYLFRNNPLPPGTVLLTGTGLIPPDQLSLAAGHRVEIHIPGIGTLVNPVGRHDDVM